MCICCFAIVETSIEQAQKVSKGGNGSELFRLQCSKSNSSTTPHCHPLRQEKEEKEKKMLETAKAQNQKGENPKVKVVKSGADDEEGLVANSVFSVVPLFGKNRSSESHEAMSLYTDIPCEHNSKLGFNHIQFEISKPATLIS